MISRVDFNVQDFEQLIEQKGYRLQWEKATICPCIDPATNHGVEGCPQCDGRGKYYYSSSEIKGVITRQNKELQIGDVFGALEPGEAYLTVPAKYKLSQFDRVTNLDSIGVYSEVIIKDLEDDDYLRYTPIGAVDFAGYQPTLKSNIINLVQGVDYTFDADGKITWLTANKPAANTGFSFRYNCHPVWLVTTMPNYIRDTFVANEGLADTAKAMPLRVSIRLEHLGPARH